MDTRYSGSGAMELDQVLYNILIQGDQLNMAVDAGTLYKVTCPVYPAVNMHTG